MVRSPAVRGRASAVPRRRSHHRKEPVVVGYISSGLPKRKWDGFFPVVSSEVAARNRKKRKVIHDRLFVGRVPVLHTVEFQKRGLPHAHILIWQDKKKRAEECSSCQVGQAGQEDKAVARLLCLTTSFVHKVLLSVALSSWMLLATSLAHKEQLKIFLVSYSCPLPRRPMVLSVPSACSTSSS